MSWRAWFLACVVLVAATLIVLRLERRASARLQHAPQDTAAIDALRNAEESLRTSVLEARAGILLHYDPVNRALLDLRDAPRVSARLRARGPSYAHAAASLDRMAAHASTDEQSVETLKSDLSLLRSSSRYFPIAVAAVARHDDDAAGKVEAVRADVERFEVAPTRETAERLTGEIAALETVRGALDEDGRADVGVIAGHARAILDRRERVDRVVRALAQSPSLQDVDEARAAHEGAVRRDVSLVSSLRIVVGCLIALAIVAASMAWRTRRGVS